MKYVVYICIQIIKFYMITINRVPGLRSLLFGKYEISDIIFFDNKTEEVVFNTDRGWLETNFVSTDRVFSNRSTDITSITLDGCDVKRKINLKSKTPFVIKSRKYCNDVYVLYIPTENVSFKFVCEQITYQMSDKDEYYNFYKLTLNCSVNCSESKEQKIYLSKPSRTIKTDFGLELDKIEKMLLSDNIHIEKYQLTELLRKYNITKK